IFSTCFMIRLVDKGKAFRSHRKEISERRLYAPARKIPWKGDKENRAFNVDPQINVESIPVSFRGG
ncbi:MAG: hypothetical protein V5A79_08115, partial [Candidatus Bipolaricaulota bacterium]